LLTNNLINWTILEQIVLVITSMCVLFLATPDTQTLWYFRGLNTLTAYSLPGWLSWTITFWIIYAGVVPISLYVVVELANAMQSLYLMLDLDMYDAASDTPAATKSTNLISEIGQVSHVFSDKVSGSDGAGNRGLTPRRTDGDFDAKRDAVSGAFDPGPLIARAEESAQGVSVGGRRFGVRVPDAVQGADQESAMPATEEPGAGVLGKRDVNLAELFKELVQARADAAISSFLLALSLCHTVVMDVDEAGQPRCVDLEVARGRRAAARRGGANIAGRYNAEGPDEEALVKAAKVRSRFFACCLSAAHETHLSADWLTGWLAGWPRRRWGLRCWTRPTRPTRSRCRTAPRPRASRCSACWASPRTANACPS
jgi:hypothetical protein